MYEGLESRAVTCPEGGKGRKKEDGTEQREKEEQKKKVGYLCKDRFFHVQSISSRSFG